MILGNNISKAYQKRTVLQSCSFEFLSGELTAITGASGSGKSTLVNIIGGLDHFDDGEVLIDGLALNSLKGKALAKYRNQNLGFVFQDHRLLPELSAWENVKLPCLIAKNWTKEKEKHLKDLLNLLGIYGLEHKQSAELSGGEKQRFAVCRALANNPKLVLADEPSGALDQTNADTLQDLFRSLCDELGSTIVFVTHNEKLANKSDKIWQLESGQLRRSK